VVNKTLEKFVHTEPTLDFDVISLDYTGIIKPRDLVTLNFLVKKLSNKNNVLLHIAHSYARDKQSEEWYMEGNYHTNSFKLIPEVPYIEALQDVHAFAEELQRRKLDVKDKVKGLEGMVDLAVASPYQREMITQFISYYAKCQRTSCENILANINEIFHKYEKPVDINQCVKDTHHLRNNPRCPFIYEYCRKNVVYEFFNIDITTAALLGPAMLREYGRLDNLSPVDRLMRQKAMADKKEKIKREAFLSAYLLSLGMLDNCLFTRNFQNYRYLSESRYPMMGTIVEIVEPLSLIKKCKELVQCLGFPKTMKVTDPRRFRQLLAEALEKWNDFMSNEKGSTFTDLGGSPKPLLTKKRAIIELMNGKSDTYLRETYRIPEDILKAIPGYKAHITMGHYRKYAGETEVSA
jgi:hypothetical protein